MHALIILNIKWVQFVFQKVNHCIVPEICIIKTAPHSTVSPQMWCIKSTKGWFTCPHICWQDFVKFKTCQTPKIWPDLFFKNLFSIPNLLWSWAIMALKCDCRWYLLVFGCTYEAINSMWDFVHSRTVCKLFFSKIT